MSVAEPLPVDAVLWPPPEAQLVYRFSVIGRPRPAGSKLAHVLKGGDGRPVMKNGEPVVLTRDSSGAEGEAWREQVARQGLAARGDRELLSGPVAVELVFFRQRPLSHFGTGRNAEVLKQSAPAWPTTRPDALKLARAIEDALTSVVYRDDSQIVEERLAKEFGDPERVEVVIWTLDGPLVPELAAGPQAEELW